MSTQPRPHASRYRHEQLREWVSRTGAPLADRARTFGGYLIAHPAVTHGSYYVLRGLWPIAAALFFREREELRTYWHSQGMGLLILVIGVTLLVSAYRGQKSTEIRVLALGSSLGLILLEASLVLAREISPAYLLDVAVQLGIVILWARASFRDPEGMPTPESPAAPAAPIAPPAGGPPPVV